MTQIPTSQPTSASEAPAEPSKATRGKDGRFTSPTGKSTGPQKAAIGVLKWPGAAPTNMANYLCHRIWGNAVNLRAGISWAQTDKKFLPKDIYPETEHLRIFYGIGYHGYDVRTPKRAEKGVDLVRIVGETEGFADTVNLYESIFWTLLAEPAPPRHEVLAQARQLLRKLGLHQTHEVSRRLGAKFFPMEPAFQPTPLAYGKTLLPWNDATVTLDHVALLVCNYRVALDCRQFDAAKFYRFSILAYLKTLMEKFKIPYELSHDLYLLVEKRIIAGQPPKEREADFFSLSARKRDQRLKLAVANENIHDSDAFRWMHDDNELNSAISPITATLTYFYDHLRLFLQAEERENNQTAFPVRPLSDVKGIQKRLDEMSVRETQGSKPKRGQPRGVLPRRPSPWVLEVTDEDGDN